MQRFGAPHPREEHNHNAKCYGDGYIPFLNSVIQLSD